MGARSFVSYIKKTEHVITISREELVEMIESRYGIDNVPSSVEIKAWIQQYHQTVDAKHNDPIKVVWRTEETFESFPEDVPERETDDIPF